jgi:hypothetical protein
VGAFYWERHPDGPFATLIAVAATCTAASRAPGRAIDRARDAAHYEDLAGRLYGLLIGLQDRLDREDARHLHHFIEVGEYGLALEDIAAALAQAQVPITGQERSDMLALTRTLEMDDLVPRALWACPRAG